MSKFSQLSGKLGRNPKIRDPRAVAAAIGNKKYGKAGMARKRRAAYKRKRRG